MIGIVQSVSNMRQVRTGILLSILLMICSLSVWAEKEYSVKTIPNVRLTNRLNHVSNPDNILTPSAVQQMNASLNHLEDSLGVQVAVVAVKKIEGGDNRSFATDLFEEWGIGNNDSDNGLLILLVTDPENRSVVFETGYGLEGALPDAICKRLQQKYMIPDLAENRYDEGMVKGITAVSSYLLSSGLEASKMIEDDGFGLSWFDYLICISVLIFGGAFVYLNNRPSVCPRCGCRNYGLLGRRTLREPSFYATGLEEYTYRCSKCGYTDSEIHEISHTGGHGGGGIFFGGGGSSFGGDFGGSWGGGSSGGGGSESRF